MTPALAAFPQPPTAGSVVLGVAGVLSGALVAATAAHLARRARNWLYHIGTAAGLLIVVGIAGQRTLAEGAAIGPWDAGILVPLLGVRITPVAGAGLVLAIVCLTLVLLFERVSRGGADRRQPVHRPLEEDDAI